MAVRIRLTRFGRSHRPFYRVVAIDSRHHREGRAKEILGTYDPLLPDKNLEVNLEQLHAWVRSGAQLSHSMFTLLRKNGYEPVPQEVIDSAAKVRAKRSAEKKSRAKKDGKKWQAPSRRALLKHRKAQKQARLSELEGKLAEHRAAKETAAAAAAPAEDAPADGEASES